MKKLTAVFLCVIMTISVAVNVFAAENIDITANYIVNTVKNPTVASVGGEWAVLGLARSGVSIPQEYFEKYYENAKNYVTAKDGALHSRKYTEYSRVIIALASIGKDPQNVAGYNLVKPLLDYEKTVWQGINGPAWALIALDSIGFGGKEIREKYIAYILENEKQNGGWALSKNQESADADITAMVLTALSNYTDKTQVNDAVQRGVTVLSVLQDENGGYNAYDEQTSESTAQVLTAISALGISYKDQRFVKNGKTLVDNILSHRKSDGSFAHTDKSNLMATEQCFYALLAAKRLEENKPSLFDMSDVKSTEIKEGEGLPKKHEHVTLQSIKYPDKTFADILEHKNKEAIEQLAKRGIINGMDENTFAPDNTMTRAEFATIVVKGLGLPLNSGIEFYDVKKDAWYYDYVNTASFYGIVNGVSNTEFNPNATITREQAATMVMRAALLCGMNSDYNETGIRNTLAEFTDYTAVSSFAKQSLAFCFENNILDRSVMEIKPFEAVKRCEIADMLYRMLKGAKLI